MRLLILAVLTATLATNPAARGNPFPPGQQSGDKQPSAATAPETLDLLLREGNDFYDHNEIELAEQRFARALELAKAQKSPAAEAEAHRGLGLILVAKAQYAAAHAEFEQALGGFQALPDALGIARVHRHLGVVAWFNGDWKEARQFWRQALAESGKHGDLREKALVLRALGFDPEASQQEKQEFAQQALDLARQIGDKDVEGLVLHHLGDDLYTAGDYAGALEKLDQAMVCLQQANDRYALARVFTSLGRLYRAHGYPDRALEFYRRTLKLQEEIGDKEGIIQSNESIGVAYAYLHKHKEALEHYERALALARETRSPRIINFLLGSVAGGYLSIGEYARAALLLEELIPRLDDSYLLVRKYTQLSEASWHLGRYAAAFQAADRALQLARAHHDSDELFKDLYWRAQALDKLGETAEALTGAEDSIHELELVRAHLVPVDFMKRGFSDWNRDIYDFAIAIHCRNGKDATALEIAEHARARAFLDLLATHAVQLKTAHRGELADARQLEKELRAKGWDFSAATLTMQDLDFRGGDPGLAELLAKWRKLEPELRSFVSAESLPSSQVTASAARLHSTVLSFWVTPDATLIWVAKPDGSVKAGRSETPAQHLADLVQQTLGDLNTAPLRGAPPEETASGTPAQEQEEVTPGPTRGGASLFLSEKQKAAWRELYRLLIHPVRSLLPQSSGSLLTIVPNGPLFRLSFAALLDEQNRYLIERYAIHYVPSMAVLQFTGQRKQQLAGVASRYLLVADPRGLPAPSGQKKLPALRGSRREVSSVSRLLHGYPVTTLTGEQAQEQAVRAALSDKTVVHLATHSIVRDDQPFDSFIALGAGGTDSSNDGRLTAQEIYSLDLHADLVFLSACRTGRGGVSGDGIVGLTRAFFYAGTPSVIATLWDVADEPTYLLVSDFYRSFSRRHDKSSALRSAQLRLLKALREGRVQVAASAGNFTLPENPLFWAGFVLQGEP